MSLHRRAAKRDSSEPAIVSALEALGCVVWRVSGKGLPDLIVLRAGKKWLADVKGPKEKPTPAQEETWEEAATKARCAVFILRTPEDAQKMLNNALQPWEPAPWCQNPGCIHRGPCPGAKPLSTTLPGGYAKRSRCGKNGCRRLRPCATHDDTETQRRLMAGYTPPRAKPTAHHPDCEQAYHKDTREPCTCGALAAAKEAEATFAPCTCAGCTSIRRRGGIPTSDH